MRDLQIEHRGGEAVAVSHDLAHQRQRHWARRFHLADHAADPALPVVYVGKAATFALMSAFPLILLGQWDAQWSRVVLACGWAFLIWGTYMYLWSFFVYAWQVVTVLHQMPPVKARDG